MFSHIFSFSHEIVILKICVYACMKCSTPVCETMVDILVEQRTSMPG